MKTALLPQERILKSGGANLQRQWETVGGKLYLTDRRLVFEAHAFNVQTGTEQIALADVVSTATSWTRLFGKLPLFPNSVSVRTAQKTEFRFVVFGRARWAQAIADAGPARPLA